MPGAAGRMCEACAYGYWNYGPTGCSKCDCEADLSMGTVCDVHTGQCHCQEGATGPRCDQCALHYLRIPTYGCRLCDECVHSLTHDLDNLGGSVDLLNRTINNVSTTALTGARLKRIENNIIDLKPLAVDHIDLASNLGIENLNGDANRVIDDIASIAIRANRSVDMLQSISSTLVDIIDSTNIFSLDAFDHVEAAATVVDSMKNLAFSLGKDSSAVDRQKWLMDSTALLEHMRHLTSDEETRIKAQKADAASEQLLGRMQERKNQGKALNKKYGSVKERMSSLINNATEYKSLIYLVASSVANVVQKLNNSKLQYMQSLLDGTKAGEAKIRETLEMINLLNTASKASIESLKHTNRTYDELLGRIQGIFDRMGAKNGRHRHRRLHNANKAEYTRKSEVLASESARLSALFGTTRNEAKNALEAANGYKELAELLQKARNMARQASGNARETHQFRDDGMVKNYS
ncbi:unnamed protein product [Gongylonema pulchrum]|uniref:Laminin EGF-like domain-containing protein n=1 Tax=Gongylonema pulchrum TaxID=637853 RepID=A0A183CXJ2_9BILA|nr:unnamed protein product [Gongylonema pulchrum]